MAEIVIEGRKEQLSFHCDDSDTVLRAALRHGIGFPYACNTGACGNCKFQLLEGEVEQLRQDSPAWSERDAKRNRYLGCQSRPQGDCRIKLRPDGSYQPEHRPERVSATLVSKQELTHDITEFSFRLDRPLQFLPGQYALLYRGGVEGPRAYSMSSLPHSGEQWDFQIKRVPGGAMTTALFDQLVEGESIDLDGPYGIAHVQQEAPRDIVCIAGGSGLSPMISIARAVAASPQLKHRRLDFVFGGRQPRDICGEDILLELPGFGSSIHYHAAVSDPAPGDDWQGHVGFVHDVAHQILGEELRNREIYFAGPPVMAQAMQKLLFELKVPPEQVHFDEFY